MRFKAYIKRILGETRVITLSIEETYNHIKKQIEKKVMHPYLLRYITSPTIDQHKLLILTSMLQKIGLTKNQLENYCLTTMLIQIALDTHDTIKAFETKEQKNLQLTVLAGDYYSGLYYKILADNNEIDLVRILSGGIKEINEQKIELYHKKFHHFEDLMNCVKKIESALISQMINFFQCQSWNPFIQNFLLLKRLLVERAQFLHNGDSIIFSAMKKMSAPDKKAPLQVKDQIILFEQYIAQVAEIIETETANIPFLNKTLQGTVSSLLQSNKQMFKTYVEEG